MAINIWTKPAEFKYVELPFEAIAAAGAAKQKAYDEGDKALTDLTENFLKIGSLPVNAARKDELIGGYQQEIYDIADQYSNDLGAALPKIKQLQRRLNADLATGELGAIKSQYDGYLERKKEIEGYEKNFMEGKGGLSPEDAQNLLNFELTNPELNGSPLKKTKYGTWEKYKPYTSMPTLDYTKVADEFASKMKPEVITELTGLMPVKDAAGNITGYMQHGNVKTTMLPSQAIELATAEAMKLDSKVTGYRNWQATISGKADKIARAVQENPNGFLSPDGMSTLSPDYVADVTMNDGIYNAAKAMGLKYRQSEIERSMSYMEDWRAKEDYKAAKAAGYTILGQAPLSTVPGSTLDPNFFDVRTGGTETIPFTPQEQLELMSQVTDPLEKSAVAAQIARGKARSIAAGSYNDLSSLSPTQKIQTDAYLKTLEKDPAFKDAVARVKAGKGSEADNKLVYPALKKMSQVAVGANQMNSVVVSIDPQSPERLLVNQMLGASTNQDIKVKDIATGFAGNMKVTAIDAKGNPVSMPYSVFVQKAQAGELGALESPVTIQGKLRGQNALTNATGDLTYANAYQIMINGKPYYLHGDYQFQEKTPAFPGQEDPGKKMNGEMVRNMFVAKFAQAQTAPTGTFTANYFNTPIEWVYMPDANNPNKGTYRLTGIGSEGGEVIPLEQSDATVFNSAEEMETALALMKYQGRMPGK